MARGNQSIVIVGAGEVGRHAAEVLLHEGYNITLIDSSREALGEVEEILDVRTLEGFGADPHVLTQAQVHRADVFLAVTDNDEVNILAAYAAKQLGAAAVVARARSQAYLDESALSFRRQLNIDLLISPEKLAAFELAKFVYNPDILAFQYFALGRVEMQRIQMTEQSFVIRQPLSELQLPGVLLLAISRGDELIVPTGEDVLEVGDVVTLVGESEHISLLQNVFHFPDERAQRVFIAGGGTVGRILAQTLETRPFNVALIERDRARAEALSEQLDKTTVLHGDATRRAFVKEERVNEADIFLSAMGDDEDNIMACILARDLGAKKVGAIIRRPDYAEVVEKIGIDAAFSPRQLTANQVVSLAHRGGVQSVTVIEDGKAEILEMRVRPEAPIANRELKDIDFPAGALVAVIARGDKVIVPKGSDRIETNDTVIVFSLTKSVDKLKRLFVK